MSTSRQEIRPNIDGFSEAVLRYIYELETERAAGRV